MYRVLTGIFIAAGVILMLLGVSYFIMVLFGMVWDWGKLIAAVVIWILGLCSTLEGSDRAEKLFKMENNK